MVKSKSASTKRSNSKKQVFKFPLVILIPLLAFLTLFIAIKNNNGNSVSITLTTDTPTPTNVQSECTIGNSISFDVPENWEKETSCDNPNPSGTITLISPKNPNADPGTWNNFNDGRLRIDISYRDNGDGNIQDRYQVVYDSVNDPNPGGAPYSELTKTSIADHEAISYFYEFEGHLHTYQTVESSRLWEINIRSWERQTESVNEYAINNFLSSIKFSDN